ncbi:copper transport protein [Paenibacillus harenae]|uniref:Copper transport protein n=1 Tax=Paenibacillus harenae TaxID=306543 RepID=A0ABT9TUI7_PAEHA|nr:copper transport protein [Paenibacillus harenae]
MIRICDNIQSTKPIRSSNAACLALLLVLLALTASILFVPAGQAAAASADAAHHHAESGYTGGATTGQTMLYIVRAFYYIALMAAAGMMIWSAALPFAQGTDPQRMHAKWSLLAVRTLLLVAIVYIFAHFNALMKSLGTSADAIGVLTETNAGRSWIALLVLAVLGFALMKQNEIVKAIWALLLLGVESLGGHTLALDNPALAIIMNFLHLICSAIWAGGVMLLMLYWYADRKEAGRFAARFTTVAWMTIVLLAVTGILMTVSLLPSWLYLIYSAWGWLLIAKAFLVLAVVVVGAFLRLRAKRKEMPRGTLLKLDGALMLAVLLIVGVLTYISPAPSTEPLNYHKMGEELHYTLDISPNGPGPNDVSLKVWLPEELGEPEEISLAILPQDRPDKVPIVVSLQMKETNNDTSFPGFKLTEYMAGKVELPYPGAWQAELVITDSDGLITAEAINFRND